MQRPQAFAPPQPPMQRPQTPAGLDRALAEIAARQRILNGQSPLPPVQQPATAHVPEATLMPAMPQVPAQDLSGLEDQLRRITDQIETLRKPGVEEAINALRDELGDIGRALSDAMPRRAIDTIENQIQGLSQRIAEGRQSGADQHALSGLEQGLAEVRDALRGLTPAENLVGFNDAVSGLAHKIDLIVAQKDPATLQQLEHAITTLREMAAHVASNDAVSELASQVHLLGQKVEDMGRSGGAGDALNHLESRIEALSHALAERAQNGSSVPPRLEALVQSLTDKIEQIQESRGDNPAVGHLEDRIVSLVERLDASDSRLGHLEAIERGLADLLVQIDDMRTSKQADSLRAEAESAVGVDSLKVDLARTQNALENVNGTLSAVVDRLARIESDIRDEGRRRAAEDEPFELTQPMGRVTARAVPEPAPAPQHLPPAAPMPEPAAAAPASGEAWSDRPRSAAGPTAGAGLGPAAATRRRAHRRRRPEVRASRRTGRHWRPVEFHCRRAPRGTERRAGRRPLGAAAGSGRDGSGGNLRRPDEANEIAVRRRQHRRHSGRHGAGRRQIPVRRPAGADGEGRRQNRCKRARATVARNRRRRGRRSGRGDPGKPAGARSGRVGAKQHSHVADADDSRPAVASGGAGADHRAGQDRRYRLDPSVGPARAGLGRTAAHRNRRPEAAQRRARRQRRRRL
jgi:localization factor PodJL